MPFNFSKPALTDNYATEFTQNIQANQIAGILWLDSTHSGTTGTIPTYAKRYNRSSSFIEEYSGTVWGNLVINTPGNAATATKSTNIIGGAAGRIPYQSALDTTLFALAGTTGQVLTSAGTGAPTWTNQASLAAGTATTATKSTNIIGGAAGSIPYQSALDTTLFALAGTTGQVLTSAGTGAPTWTNQASLAVGTATTATKSTNIIGGAAGRIPYQSALDTTLFALAGTTGQVLTSAGTGAPTWTSQSSLIAGTANSLNTANSYTVTGLTVGTGVSSSIIMQDTDDGSRTIHNNSNQIGFLTQAGAWGSYCDDSGNWTAAGNVTAYSDIRLKSDLVIISDALSKVHQLTGYIYTRTDSGLRQTGLIAQDLQKVLPEAVVNTGEYLSVAYGNIVGLLVEAIKELKSEIDNLKQNT